MENVMDRRRRKTREAIFDAFTKLLAEKKYERITVGDIIEGADIGRATFYAHFETKDYLLKEFCEELFCHLFDAEKDERHIHRHIFDCDFSESVFLHLFKHLQNNDRYILKLLSSDNNELFLRYFGQNLKELIESHLSLFENVRKEGIPDDFWKEHIAAVFVQTVRWWVHSGMRENAEQITEYFFKVV